MFITALEAAPNMYKVCFILFWARGISKDYNKYKETPHFLLEEFISASNEPF